MSASKPIPFNLIFPERGYLQKIVSTILDIPSEGMPIRRDSSAEIACLVINYSDRTDARLEPEPPVAIRIGSVQRVDFI